MCTHTHTHTHIYIYIYKTVIFPIFRWACHYFTANWQTGEYPWYSCISSSGSVHSWSSLPVVSQWHTSKRYYHETQWPSYVCVFVGELHKLWFTDDHRWHLLIFSHLCMFLFKTISIGKIIMMMTMIQNWQSILYNLWEACFT